MRGDDAFAVLGLRPGAGRAEIDQAYRRLIKRHHPDYAGGDASRAADINRAYSELRTLTREALRPNPAPAMPIQDYRRPPSSWRGLMVVAAAIGAALLLARGAAMTESTPSWARFESAETSAAMAESRAVRASRESFSLEEPLAKKLIDGSVDDAMRLHADKDPVVAAQFSRDCLSRLSASPSVPLFDACAAYDEAIAILGVGNPAFESGPFNPSAVTARQVGAARLLSADYFEAESRLQQIRSRVQLVLLPQISGGFRASEQRVSAPVVAPIIAELAEPIPDIEPRAEPRPTVRRVRAASSPPQLVRRPAPQQRQPPPARRVAPPSAPRAAPPPSRPAPAWQQPIRPAWQRPLPPATE